MPLFLISKKYTINQGDEDLERTATEPIGYFNGTAEEARIYCEKIKSLQDEFKLLKKKKSILLKAIVKKVDLNIKNQEKSAENLNDFITDLGNIKKELELITNKIFDFEKEPISTIFLKDNPEPENVQDVFAYDYQELQEVK